MALPRPAAGQRRWWVLGGLLGAAAVAFAVWVGLDAGRQVRWTDVAYHVVDDRTVETTFDVYRPDGRATTCTVKAMDAGFGVVGSREIDVPGSDQQTVRLSTTIRTTSRAVTGVVDRCTQQP